MPQITVSQEEFERFRQAGTNPLTDPKIQGAMARVKAKAQADANQATDAFLEGSSEDGRTLTIGGFRCRPLNLATFMLFSRSGNSLVTGQASTDPISDAMIALWILAGPESEVLKSVRDPNLLWDSAYRFATGVEFAEFKTIYADLQKHIESVVNAIGGEDGGEKKVPTATGSAEPSI